ncbi:uncharacterized protein scimp [Stegastes partitus]|uniref:Uncharacterized protein LOC103357765 n=1 Tax=Stegastes partitus TaxID=144197 RepID=A0A9Y4JQS5_9TELE|nr:PREDICTED: uncharacterized protein LOC103357765 [Stegastes partitus]XP_008280685.1 PREDICTED: uncharacterized protein LOC103357765 [Stegastes partitus]XP_008280686.1 PREDICTED: uncharacterized protein LOC103357765 [Stegastes partitus]
MNFFRQYALLLLIGAILVSLVICFIFFLINKCISKRGEHQFLQRMKTSAFKVESNKYQERDPEAIIPPLPPRTQFLTAEAQSYENLAEVPDYEQCADDYEQCADDYEQCTADYEQSTADYEQSTDQQPEYVKVEEEEEILPPPTPYNQPDPEINHGVSEGQSYENLAEEPDYEQAVDEQPDYVQVEDEAETFLPQPPDPAADNSSTEDYDDIGEDQGEDYDDVG